ncbi:carbohydrate ABC transporter substrate-binding protein (CUT1 family) [Hydrogenispora ethanolica]|jgi:raffinose/stachyose/melibiose transport system substrate-binding protein|uniref:Carbohydrate ABC transporter substrate-binding protein (CUT1 family) n=1 Tax=Hydrogenispora ethanolica TaxID=1082276 RepID=A0A4R1R868_HYDET|nr:extracellular solute-binding protein [Hydrogenispora ethanolica]TCL61788.1 carbohydrate ABC transporter substrate-binding protein (CUT1 family) [Hydrogenispora ethanolica]
MKRFFPVLLAVMIAVTCSLSSITLAKKKISFWHIQVNKVTGSILDAAVKRFEKDHPDVDVEVVASENDPYKTKLKIAMGSGNPPDVFHSWGGGWLETFIEEGQVLNISKQLNQNGWKDIYVPSYLDMAKFNGKYYGVPANMSCALVWYNKELFKKYNVEVPKTYKELLKAITVFKSNNIIPISLGNKSKWPGALIFVYLADRIGGPSAFQNAYLRKRGFSFEAPTFIEAGKRVQELVSMGAFPEGFNGINYDNGESRILLYSGKAAMEIGTSAYLSFTKNEAPDFFKNNFDCFPFPAIEGGKGDPSDLVGGTYIYSVASKSKNKKESIELLRYISDKVYGQEWIDKAGNLAPVKGVEVKDPLLKKVADYMAQAKYIQAFYDQFLPPTMGELHKDTTQALFGKTMTPQEAAQKMEAKAKEELVKK